MNCSKLNGALAVMITCGMFRALAAFAAETSAIGIYSGNPFYWQYQGKPVLLLGGSTGPEGSRTLNDEGMFLWPDATEALDKLAKAGGNYVRCLMSGRLRDEPLWPFARQGDRYDLDQWDADYWRHFATFLKETKTHGIIVQIELWATFDYARVPWTQNPFNPKNNRNYTAEATGLAAEEDSHPVFAKNQFYYTIPAAKNVSAVLKYQQRFADKILAHTLPYDHVLYCMDNETRASPTWGAYWSSYVRGAAAQGGRKICVTEMFGSHDLRDPIFGNVIDHPELYDFIEIAQNNHQPGQTHYDNMQGVRNRIRAAPRPLSNVKIYGVDGGRFGTSQDAMERFWRNIFGGCASSRFHEKHLGGSESAHRMIKSAREVFGVFDVFHAAPRNDLLLDRGANEAYCLADPSRQYAVYFPAGGEVRLDLRDVEGKVQLRWYSIAGGRWMDPEQVQGKKPVILTTPGPGQWAAILRTSLN